MTYTKDHRTLRDIFQEIHNEFWDFQPISLDELEGKALKAMDLLDPTFFIYQCYQVASPACLFPFTVRITPVACPDRILMAKHQAYSWDSLDFMMPLSSPTTEKTATKMVITRLAM